MFAAIYGELSQGGVQVPTGGNAAVYADKPTSAQPKE